jgi:hypothetical protein
MGGPPANQAARTKQLPARSSTMLDVRSWTLDDWNVTLQWMTTVFTGAAVLTGGITILVGKRIDLSAVNGSNQRRHIRSHG